jgi:hypothetical protein
VHLRQDAVTGERHDGSVEVLVELEVRLPPALGVPGHQLRVHDVELRRCFSVMRSGASSAPNKDLIG